MADLIVPRVGVSVTEVTIVEWLVEDGASVQPGDSILTVATDKTDVDVEATVAGKLTHAAVPEEVYAVGSVIGSID